MPMVLDLCLPLKSSFNSSKNPNFPNWVYYGDPNAKGGDLTSTGFFNTLRDLPDTDPRKIKTGDFVLWSVGVTVVLPIDEQNYPYNLGPCSLRSVSALYPNVVCSVVT